MTMIIYKVTNKINSKSYIGCTRFTLEERKKKHLTDYKLNTFKHRKFYAALNKHGEDSFTWEVIDTAETKAEAIEREKYWIAFCNSCRHGYNANNGGSGTNGYIYSDETRMKMREAKLGIPKTDEHKKRMSESAMKIHQGERHGMSKLTSDNVYIIKKLLANKNMTQARIAEMYNVAQGTIASIKQGKTWKHVKIKTV